MEQSKSSQGLRDSPRASPSVESFGAIPLGDRRTALSRPETRALFDPRRDPSGPKGPDAKQISTMSLVPSSSRVLLRPGNVPDEERVPRQAGGGDNGRRRPAREADARHDGSPEAGGRRPRSLRAEDRAPRGAATAGRSGRRTVRLRIHRLVRWLSDDLR